MDQKFVTWVNIKISDRELLEQLDAMCEADERSRSDFMRRLVKHEFARRAANLAQGGENSTNGLKIAQKPAKPQIGAFQKAAA